MKNLIFLTAVANSYIVNRCRDFSNQLVPDFDFENFTGEWFPIYQSKNSMRVRGKCPVWNFEYFEALTNLQAQRIAKVSESQSNFKLHKSYKGMAGLVDNLQHFMGYLDKGTSNGSLWVGVTIQPMKHYKDNFQILSSDYENYAILYTCTSLTAMYNQDDITILTRESPAFGAIDPEILKTIKSEFERLFGVNQSNQKQPEKEHEEDVFKKTEELTGEEIEKPAENLEKATEDEKEILEEKLKKATEDGEEILEENVKKATEDGKKILKEKGTGAVAKYGKRSRGKTNQEPLQFEVELQEVDHKGCEDYPDLSLNQVQRDKIKVQKQKQSIEGV